MSHDRNNRGKFPMNLGNIPIVGQKTTKQTDAKINVAMNMAPLDIQSIRCGFLNNEKGGAIFVEFTVGVITFAVICDEAGVENLMESLKDALQKKRLEKETIEKSGNINPQNN